MGRPAFEQRALKGVMKNMPGKIRTLSGCALMWLCRETVKHNSQFDRQIA